MANQLYGKAREKFLGGNLSWSSGTIKAVLIDVADYTVAIDTHEFLSDVPGAARVATSATLTGKSITLGVADVQDFAFTAVTGDPSEAVIFYVDTGTASTSSLVSYHDTATGLPVTPNGGDINIAVDNGSNRLFKL